MAVWERVVDDLSGPGAEIEAGGVEGEPDPEVGSDYSEYHAAIFRVRTVVGRWPGNQVIIWLDDEQNGLGEDPTTGASYCVRVPLTDARAIARSIDDAYAETIQAVAFDLACGGCTFCKNKRLVNGDHCPVCWERGQKRLTDRISVMRWRGQTGPTQ